MHVKFEYTLPSMSQQNGRVEHKYAVLYNRVHSMLNGVELSSILEMVYVLMQLMLSHCWKIV